MDIRTQIAVAILISQITIIVTFPQPNEINQHPLEMVNLGEVDGKSYFTDFARLEDWFGAKAYCETSNLTLASIDSKSEMEFLNRTLRAYPFSFYWTSSHESRRPSMMVWDGTNNSPDPAILENWAWERPAYQYCGLLNLVNSSHYRMLGYRCDYTERVLCQS